MLRIEESPWANLQIIEYKAMKNQMMLPQETAMEQTSPKPSMAYPRAGFDTGWEVVIGTLVGVGSIAEALVEISRHGSTTTMNARTIFPLDHKQIGQQAVLAFEGGDLSKPIILGLVQTAGDATGKTTVTADGDRFVVNAEREIELRCGEASITLTRAGKVLIKGEYVLTRAKGVNRIKGAAVSIN